MATVIAPSGAPPEGRAPYSAHCLTWRRLAVAAGFLGLLKSRSVRLLMGMTAFGWAPLSETATVSIYFGVHVMGFTEEEASLVMLTWFIAGLAWLPLVSHLTHRWGKKQTYGAFTMSWAFVQSLFLLVDAGDLVLF